VAQSISLADNAYLCRFGDGLVLRWSRPQDVERVASLYADVFRAGPDAPLNAHVARWTRELFSGRHPHVGPHDFAVAQEKATGAIVAAMGLLRYPIAFEGVTVPFGRPEEVATHPDYRNRGLIRALFEMIHARSETRGDLVQGIRGIPHYYRQFGYEYSIPMGTGLSVTFAAIPPLQKDTREPYQLRKAMIGDIPLLRRLWQREQLSAAISTPLSVRYCRCAIESMHAGALERWHPYLIVDPSGRSAGYLRLKPRRWGPEVIVDGLMVEEGVPLVTVLPSVLRGAQALAETTAAEQAETPPASAVRFHLWNGDHPLRSVLPSLAPVSITFPYSAYPDLWYIRVPDLARFIRHVTPALEQRLASTAHTGYTGKLMLDFYRGGLRLAFDGGKLALVENWQRPVWGKGNAGCPPLIFLQLLFGYRSLHELRTLYPDVWAAGEAAAVLDALFPKRQTCLIPLD
jgi:GNAT superfamily N-acetyltransferase